MDDEAAKIQGSFSQIVPPSSRRTDSSAAVGLRRSQDRRGYGLVRLHRQLCRSFLDRDWNSQPGRETGLGVHLLFPCPANCPRRWNPDQLDQGTLFIRTASYLSLLMPRPTRHRDSSAKTRSGKTSSNFSKRRSSAPISTFAALRSSTIPLELLWPQRTRPDSLFVGEFSERELMARTLRI